MDEYIFDLSRKSVYVCGEPTFESSKLCELIKKNILSQKFMGRNQQGK